ncbi:uncharacterized protein [Centruroides vittatus]|uniref:uncharacterized protein n=1 Tax=Centruroides vittatus TaxID=120091 RepID=UPI00350F571F
MLTEAMLPVVEVRRFTRKLNDRAEVTPSTTVYFSIASADPIESVKLYYQRFRCERFYPKPRFCGRCLTFGHAPASCRGRRRCLNCGEDHDSTGCSRPAEKCVRCGGPHRADSPNCPAYLSEARLLKLSVIHRCSHAEAKRLRPSEQSSYAQVAAKPKPLQVPEAKSGPSGRVESTHQADSARGPDHQSLTRRIARLEAAIDSLRAELRQIRSEFRSTPPTRESELLLPENISSQPQQLPTSQAQKRPPQREERPTLSGPPRKKKGNKQRKAAPKATSDSDGPASDMDLSFPPGPTRTVSLEDFGSANPAEKVKLRHRQSAQSAHNA